ncbi:hypothetical protein CRUP_020535 [Coryphaenoides rupestris]|nr:hypothetical protein CRUP_020535 [Coryphaenoides rupestris]
MSVLRENQCYGLAAGGVSGSGGVVSVFHVKLTDSAARAFDTYQRALRQSPLSHPVICFAGDQGRITVPCPEGGGDKRTFTFSLTNVDPHGSFDCVRQVATSAAGAGQLSCMGLVQRRLTVNATDDSYQKAWQNMAQVEEETRKRAAIIIKDGVRVQKKRVTVRAPGPALVSLARPRSTNTRSLLGRRRSSLSGGGGGGRSARARLGAGPGPGPGVEVDKRPLRERLVHLLAVRPYRRPELLLRLRQDGLTDGEKDSLDTLLLEVAHANANANLLC